MRNRSGDNRNVVYGLFALIGVLIIIAGIAIFLYFDTQNKFKNISLSSVVPTPSAQDIKDIVDRLSRHMLLPDETPRMITITNSDVLKKTQPFFTKAKDGYKLLIYGEKVIMYDPVTDKIIDIAAIRPQNIPISPITSKYKLMILNGTNTQNLSQNIEPTITQFKEIEITSKAFAQKRDYTVSILVDVKNSTSPLATTLAQATGASLESLPAEELKPPKDIDFILILGEK